MLEKAAKDALDAEKAWKDKLKEEKAARAALTTAARMASKNYKLYTIFCQQHHEPFALTCHLF